MYAYPAPYTSRFATSREAFEAVLRNKEGPPSIVAIILANNAEKWLSDVVTSTAEHVSSYLDDFSPDSYGLVVISGSASTDGTDRLADTIVTLAGPDMENVHMVHLNNDFIGNKERKYPKGKGDSLISAWQIQKAAEEIYGEQLSTVGPSGNITYINIDSDLIEPPKRFYYGLLEPVFKGHADFAEPYSLRDRWDGKFSNSVVLPYLRMVLGDKSVRSAIIGDYSYNGNVVDMYLEKLDNGSPAFIRNLIHRFGIDAFMFFEALFNEKSIKEVWVGPKKHGSALNYNNSSGQQVLDTMGPEVTATLLYELTKYKNKLNGNFDVEKVSVPLEKMLSEISQEELVSPGKPDLEALLEKTRHKLTVENPHFKHWRLVESALENSGRLTQDEHAELLTGLLDGFEPAMSSNSIDAYVTQAIPPVVSLLVYNLSRELAEQPDSGDFREAHKQAEALFLQYATALERKARRG